MVKSLRGVWVAILMIRDLYKLVLFPLLCNMVHAMHHNFFNFSQKAGPGSEIASTHGRGAVIATHRD